MSSESKILLTRMNPIKCPIQHANRQFARTGRARQEQAEYWQSAHILQYRQHVLQGLNVRLADSQFTAKRQGQRQ